MLEMLITYLLPTVLAGGAFAFAVHKVKTSPALRARFDTLLDALRRG